jgi:hypothetical protein
MPETTQLLDPKNDYVFKRLFTSAPELLVSLINAIRTDMPPITRVEILNPRIEPEELTGKFIILDILAEDAEAGCTTLKCKCAAIRPGARAVCITWPVCSALSSKAGWITPSCGLWWAFICWISTTSRGLINNNKLFGASNCATAPSQR